MVSMTLNALQKNDSIVIILKDIVIWGIILVRMVILAFFCFHWQACVGVRTNQASTEYDLQASMSQHIFTISENYFGNLYYALGHITISIIFWLIIEHIRAH